jgi:hypothetical protein
MKTNKNKKAVLRCIDLFNKYDLEWIDSCYSKKLDWNEFSNPTFPQGRKGDYSVYRNAAQKLLTVFPDRKLTVLNCVADGDNVVLEQEWTGTLAISIGDHKPGEISKLQIASFFTLENGLIIKQNDYCARTI